MYCNKPSPILILLWNTLIVAVIFMLLDFLYYGLISPGPDPYTTGLVEKIIFTILFSLAFAHLYNKASRIWRPNSDEAFLFKQKVVPAADLCKISFPKVLNGVVFSLLVSAVIIMAMALSTLILSTLFLYVFQGIRGELLGGTEGAVVLVTEIVISGIALEWEGRTEDDPDR